MKQNLDIYLSNVVVELIFFSAQLMSLVLDVKEDNG